MCIPLKDTIFIGAQWAEILGGKETEMRRGPDKEKEWVNMIYRMRRMKIVMFVFYFHQLDEESLKCANIDEELRQDEDEWGQARDFLRIDDVKKGQSESKKKSGQGMNKEQRSGQVMIRKVISKNKGIFKVRGGFWVRFQECCYGWKISFKRCFTRLSEVFHKHMEPGGAGQSRL